MTKFKIGVLVLIVMALGACNLINSKKTIDVKPGLSLNIIKTSDKGTLIKENDPMAVYVIMYDSAFKVIKDFGLNPTATANKNMWGFMYPALLKLKVGDSAILNFKADSLFGPQMPPNFKAGDKINFSVKIISKEQIDAMAKNAEASNETAIKKYFADNNITNAIRTPEGLYYSIEKEGTGPIPAAGQKVVVNYTGKLLDGKVFDSNVLKENNHVEPFEFELGKGRVIPGWDLAFSLLKKGTKGTLVIPSQLAYGEQPPPGSIILPNSCLVFDVELLDVK
jgi:FKBP-type peptidyl-prolyl cis-trans isomerase FkpA